MESEPAGVDEALDVGGEGEEDRQSTARHAAAAGAPKKKRLTIASLMPLVALSLSLFSLYESSRARAEVARLDVIKTEYALFNDMARLQLDHPLMAHLFATTGQAYDSRVEMVRAARPADASQERAKLMLEEQALTHFIFMAYEQTFYLWREAEGGDERRLVLARGDLMYFKDLLCNNPRLQWFWGPDDGGRLGRDFALELQDYHRENVAKDCPGSKDSIGPFGKAETP